ncbi:hypothetical protein NDU88_005469 [Pleurodeles waltl]|uniref:Uncharacterized protein n=1 Tax=Pleurodeles waltl TaxID=8319 RepID=A0AAV7VJ34_PLEWA|nr:hypothetical protein NDU88_005469 [Pleurodeles waltl]
MARCFRSEKASGEWPAFPNRAGTSSMQGIPAAPTPSTSAAPVATPAPVLPPPAAGPSQLELDIRLDVTLILQHLDRLEEALAEDRKVLKYIKKKVKNAHK